MISRVVVTLIAACCLTTVVGCGVSALAIQRGLVSPPLIAIRAGPLEVITFNETVLSNIHPKQAYFTVWVFVRFGPSPNNRARRLLRWGHQLLRLEVPPAPPRTP
jgi:hypothetical protein